MNNNESYINNIRGVYRESLAIENLTSYGITGLGIRTAYTSQAIIGAVYIQDFGISSEIISTILDAKRYTRNNIILLEDVVEGQIATIQYLY